MKYSIFYLNFLFFSCQVIFFRNSKFGFFFIQNMNNFLVFKFSFFLSRTAFFLRILNNFLLVYSDFFKKYFNTFQSILYLSFFNYNFFQKRRLRFSGLGFGLDLISNGNNKFVQINAGFTQPPIIAVPRIVYHLKVSRKKKKVLFYGFLPCLISNFVANIRCHRLCDVYKHKGIRWRFEKVLTKEGKRSGKR